jgi:nickel/cobalt exporter
MHDHTSELTIGLSFVLGALHALEPGHGKTAMLACLLNGRTSRWQPLVMGFSTALSHSLSLFSLAFVVHMTHHAVTGDHHHEQWISQILQSASAVLILTVGGYLLVQAVRGKRPQCCGTTIQHAEVRNPLSIMAASSDKNCGCHADNQQSRHGVDATAGGYKTTALLGLAVGLLPCPSALAAFFTGLSSGSPSTAYLIVAMFSCGIACSLTFAGGAAQYFGERLGNRMSWASALPWGYLRACLILGVGLFYLAGVVSG